MDTSARIVKNTTYLYVKMVVSMTISFYTARVFLNVLGASDYGLYTLIAGVIFMFGFFQDTLTRATLRYLCYYKSKDNILEQRKVYSISVFMHLGIAIIIAINLMLLTNFLFSGILNIDVTRIHVARLVYYFMIASFCFTVMTVPYDSVLNANEDMRYYSVVGIVESLSKLALALYLPFVNYDKLVFFSLMIAIITIVSLVVKRVYCHVRYVECKVKWTYLDKKIAHGMISYAGWNFLTSITSLVSFNAMPILLNVFFGTIVNAAQGVASQINGVLTSFSTNIIKALSPIITKMGNEESELDRMKQFALSGSKLSFIVLCFLSVPLIVECPYILKKWLVNVPQWSSVFCMLLLIRTVTNQLETVYADCVYANENIKNYCIIKGILNLLPIGIVYLCFKAGSAPYVLYVALFFCWEFLGGVAVIYYNHKMYKLDVKKYLFRLLLPCFCILLVGLILGFSVNRLLHESLTRLMFNTVLSTILIAILSWLFVLDEKERVLVKGLSCRIIVSSRKVFLP